MTTIMMRRRLLLLLLVFLMTSTTAGGKAIEEDGAAETRFRADNVAETDNNETESTTSRGPRMLATRQTTTVTMAENRERGSTNGRHVEQCAQCQPLTERLLLAALFAPIIAIGVAGNLFVVLVIIRDRKMRGSTINLFLLNLACADLGNLVFVTPDIVLALWDGGWVLPDVTCPAFRFLQEYFLYASVLLQMSVGIERYLAICAPLRSGGRMSRRTAARIAAFVWLAAAAFASPYMVTNRARVRPIRAGVELPVCAPEMERSAKTAYRHIEFTLLFVSPLALLSVLYSLMARVLWGSQRRIADRAQQASVLRLRRSVVKMLIISILIYIVCYSPSHVAFLYETLSQRVVYTPPWLRLLSNVLSLTSSSANPIVYILCCRHFRSRFTALLSHLCLSVGSSGGAGGSGSGSARGEHSGVGVNSATVNGTGRKGARRKKTPGSQPMLSATTAGTAELLTTADSPEMERNNAELALSLNSFQQRQTHTNNGNSNGAPPTFV